MEATIGPLRSGGLMTSYLCSSRCAHCAYLCGPDWTPDYIDEASTVRALEAVTRGGCRSVHVGGGEPFLRPERLLAMLERCRDEGVGIEYIETNAAWFVGSEANNRLLHDVRIRGVSTLLVSISPFHNAHIPFTRTRGLIEACGLHGISVFPWVSEFIADIEAFDPATPHALSEYEERYGPGYVRRIPERYWVSLRGRAVETFSRTARQIQTQRLLDGLGPCSELYGTSHFHVDLYGNYIPGVCSGLAVDVDDVPGALSRERYPVLVRLMEEGPSGLVAWARDEHGFEPRESYGGKCELCYDARRFLSLEAGFQSRDLEPRELYAKIAAY